MSVRNLATKYRPKDFDDLCEQESIKIILQNQIKNNNIKHAYLFCGGAGTGKTTSARIIANMMNNNQGTPMEIDCASHNGVDDMRAIQDECKTKPLVGKYKIFVLDECFVGDSLVKTKQGNKKIKDIKPGDLVATSSGYHIVNNVFKKSIPKNRLVNIHLSNGEDIITTLQHLFMTTEGWIEASKLRQGDELIVYNKLSKLWQGDSYKQKREEVLQLGMLQTKGTGFEEEKETPDICKEMCHLWKQFCCRVEQEEYENLFCNMQEKINISVREDDNEFRIWNGIKETIIKKNEEEKSNAQESQYRENEDYERIEWNSTSTFQGEGWKWQIYRTPNEIIREFRRFLDIGISNTNSNKEKQQPNEISYIIQSRPWLSYEEDSCRGGWQIPQYEKWYATRYKETESIGRVRVESVTFYESGSDEQFESSSDGYTEVYDLNVDDDCTYFINNVLVHNCHMLTVQAWNSLLKILEEPPDYVIFLFCTTDPQKIIGTIMSRVQRFNFQRISVEGIRNRLLYILQQENITTYEIQAIDYIARLAKGGMRDSITTLEKCLDYDINLTLENVLKVTSGGVTEETMLQLLKYMLNKQCREALEYFNSIYMTGVDVSLFLKLFTEYLENCVKYLITRNISITTLSNITADWLSQQVQFLDTIRTFLLSSIRIRAGYNSEDLKIMVESWIIQECS